MPDSGLKRRPAFYFLWNLNQHGIILNNSITNVKLSCKMRIIYCKNQYEEGMNREIKEEVYIETEYVNNIVAPLNDDSNEVGKVHFGIVHIFRLNKPEVSKKNL